MLTVTMSNISNLTKCSVDSLKLRLQISVLDSYDKRMDDMIIQYNENTAEEQNRFKERALNFLSPRLNNGFELNYSLYASTKNSSVSLGHKDNCVEILINSKQLEHKYFQGITITNICVIYNMIIELGIIKCSFKTFMDESLITDIDFKKDFYLELSDYKEMIKGCDEMTKLSKKEYGGNISFTSPTNYGIQWGKSRSTEKFKTYPFTKIYHKTMELSRPKEKKGSLQFAQQHLRGINYKDIIRVETTVKNKEHLQHLKLGLTKFNLREILELSDEKKDSILAKAFNLHLLRRTRKAYRTKGKLTPANEMNLGQLSLMINTFKYSFNEAIRTMISPITCPVAKSNKKRSLTALYEDYIYKTDYVLKSKNIENIYSEIGLI